MTTVADVLNLSLKDAGILGESDAASAETFNDAYQTFLQMLSLWQTDNVYVYAQEDTSYAANGSVSYTVGSAGNFAVLRPEKIDYVYWTNNGHDYEVSMLSSFEEYESIVDKTVAGDPEFAYYNPSYTNGTLYIYPQPSTGTLHIVTEVAFPTLATTASTLSLPPKYVLPARLSLAELLCSTFNMPVPQALGIAAARARKLLKRSNVRIQELNMPLSLPYYRRSKILRG